MRTFYRFIFSLLVFCQAAIGYAQQDPMFTKYVFNGLAFNPAYAGSKDHLTVNLLHRGQWFGLEGAPATQSFCVYSPLKNQHIALGFNLVNDKIGGQRQHRPEHRLCLPDQNAQRLVIVAGRAGEYDQLAE